MAIVLTLSPSPKDADTSTGVVLSLLLASDVPWGASRFDPGADLRLLGVVGIVAKTLTDERWSVEREIRDKHVSRPFYVLPCDMAQFRTDGITE